MSALFVTATGTDVGKTYVACLMIRALRARGRAVRALKPVATGFDPERPEDSDAGRLLASLGQAIHGTTLDALCPWRFSAPLSPDMAAAREGRTIDWRELVDCCRRTIDAGERNGAVTLIEGIGGTMVPLDDRRTVLDLIAELGVPSLLVAGSYLGTLSHTLTAAGMLAARGCRIAGVIVDESPQQPVAPEETAATLRRFLAPVPIVVVPRGASRAPAHDENLAAALVALLDSE
jgi:dethiobiotin synthetase